MSISVFEMKDRVSDVVSNLHNVDYDVEALRFKATALLVAACGLFAIVTAKCATEINANPAIAFLITPLLFAVAWFTGFPRLATKEELESLQRYKRHPELRPIFIALQHRTKITRVEFLQIKSITDFIETESKQIR